MLNGKTIVIGITGSIAAYKAIEIISKLKNLGADVWVILTEHGKKFITPLTLKTLSANPVVCDIFDEETLSKPVLHISLAEKADLILIVPATANIIGKIASGIADDLLLTLTMSSKAPKIIAPAMNANMWENSIVVQNVIKLKKLGYKFVEPEVGRLACGDIGIGRLAEIGKIIGAVIDKIGQKQDLSKKKVLVTAGGTREYIDPVRFIGNPSSGKMGYALAYAARDRGADVTLISAPVQINPPENVKLVRINSAHEMYEAVMNSYKDTDVVVMAAAVADFTPIKNSKVKIKKSKFPPKADQSLAEKNIQFQPTKDILLELGKKKGKRKLVGFALETDNLIANAKKKLKEKNLDLVIANSPAAFGSDTSTVSLIYKNGRIKRLSNLSKHDIAQEILNSFSI